MCVGCLLCLCDDENEIEAGQLLRSLSPDCARVMQDRDDKSENKWCVMYVNNVFQAISY